MHRTCTRPLTFTTALTAFALAAMLGGCGKPHKAVADPVEGQHVFQHKCVTCHTIGQGKRVGPDLANVQKRRTHAWLVRWIGDPEAMRQSDPTAKQLYQQFKVPMPNLNLDDDQIESVLAYIAHASGKG